MPNRTVSFEIPESILVALNENIDEFISGVRLSAAINFFKNHKLSLGKAAQLACLQKERFREELAKNKIPIIDYEPEDLENELDILRKAI